MSIYNQETKFYVYMYLRSKKSERFSIGSPYYVGKGQGNRAFASRKFKPKDEKFIKIYAYDLSEEDAFFLEIMLVARYGRIDLGTGSLRNRTDGGEGCCGVKFSKERRAEISIRYSGTKNPNFGNHYPKKICDFISECTAKRNTNRKWFNDGFQNKFCISCPIGFKRGRLHQVPTTKGNKWYNNGVIQKLSFEKPSEINWVRGMLPKRQLGCD